MNAALTMDRVGAGSFRQAVLPWSAAAADEKRFRRIVQAALLAVVLLALWLRVATLPPAERKEAQALPPPLAKLLIDRKPEPPPPPANPGKPEAARPDAKAAPTPEPTPAPVRRAPPPPAAAAPAREPLPGRSPGEIALEQARAKAASSGLLALRNELAAITAAPLAVQMTPPDASKAPLPGVGSGSGPGVGAGSDAGEPARALVTASAGRGSGGIATGPYSRDSGGGGLAGRNTSVVGGDGGGGGGSASTTLARTRPGTAVADARAGGPAPRPGGSGKPTRAIEDIKLVFERNKAAIYAIYTRALRDDPALQGKVVLELKIAPGGQVESARIVSSELKAEDLERKLLARIRQFDFGAKDVDTLVLTWPVDFLPS